MFPGSGVPPGDAKNSLVDPTTINCDELWYSTSRCQPRFDPAAANAQLAELINLVNKGEVAYDCAKLDQVQLAVNYLGQRGIHQGVLMLGGPFNYTGIMDPPATRYNDYMTIKAVATLGNGGPVRLDLNGLGPVPVLRNDGQEMREADVPSGVPQLYVYYAGKFYAPYFVRSQSPIEYKGTLDYWVRTDGSDATGDGSANSPGKAFRTINYAFTTALNRYSRSPDMLLQIRLGIPGDYEAGQFSKFPGVVNLFGDPVAYAGYRIHTSLSSYCCLVVETSTVNVHGVNMIIDRVGPNAGESMGLFCWRNGYVAFHNSGVEININGGAIQTAVFQAAGYGSIQIGQGSILIDGKGHTIGMGMAAQGNGSCHCVGAPSPNQQIITWKQCNFLTAAYWAYALSGVGVTDNVVGGVPLSTVVDNGCVGMKYNSTVNSFVYGGGKVVPGTIAGTVADGGVFKP